MPSITVPDYGGGSLVNLVAEIERRLTGSSPSPGLSPELAAVVPDAPTYVLALFDGLGDHQLSHPAAAMLLDDRRNAIDTVFPTTTTVSLSSVATAVEPRRHGLLGYQLWLPELGVVANTIKWTTLWGEPLDVDTAGFLPRPNLWERIATAGIEPVAIQPAAFEGSPLSRVLYRGCRFEGVTGVGEWVAATAELATAGRLVFAYLPQVDFAAHVYGQSAPEYGDALAVVATAWERLARTLPAGAALIGTADHGHIDFPAARRFRIPKEDHEGRTFYGDGRAMFVKGDGAELADRLPATWIRLEDMEHWWGPESTEDPSIVARMPDGVLVADDDAILLHRFSDDRLIGNHGALTDAERRVPLLVAGD